MEADLFGALAEALTADHEVVLANDGVAVHADAALAASGAVLLRVSVPQVVGHDERVYLNAKVCNRSHYSL